jgi:adenosylhomocysteine nucleosidase
MATSSVEQETCEGESPLLVVAALARELAPLGREARAGMVLIETGEGIRNSERAVRSWLDQRAARAVLGIGFAGALSASLKIGDLVIARNVCGADRAGESFVSSPVLLSAAGRVRLEGLSFGTAITVDEIVGEASAKRQLSTLLARDEIGCVDMESSAVARVCGERNLPFLIVRSITDLLGEDLPLDFNRCRAADGRVSAQRVIRAALARPKSFKGLLELRRRSDLCAERLAAFVRLLLPSIYQDRGIPRR